MLAGEAVEGHGERRTIAAPSASTTHGVTSIPLSPAC
jgi:hypothetical protein